MNTAHNKNLEIFQKIAVIGRVGRQKSAVVPLPSPSSEQIFAAYLMSQGRRAGRKTEFADCFHLDGLFVEQAVPPAAGVIKIMPELKDSDVLRAGIAFNDNSLWEKHHICQVLVTNGRVWASMIRSNSGEMELRELFSHPLAALKHSIGGYELPDPSDERVFNERLRRALMPWRDIENPQILGTYLASYARSYSMALAQDSKQSGFRNKYERALRERLGVVFAEKDTAENISLHLVAVLLLNMIGDALTIPTGAPLTIELPAELRHGFDRLPVRDGGVGIHPATVVADAIRKQPSPAFVLDICKTFWAELAGNNRSLDEWNLLPETVHLSHVDLLEQSLRESMSAFFSGLGDSKVHWLDPRAGVGCLLGAVLSEAKERRQQLRGKATAIEADPVKFQILRLRVLASVIAGASSAEVNLTLANPLLNSRAVPKADENEFLIIGCDLRFPGERMLEIEGNAKRADAYQRAARDVWRIRTFDRNDRFVQYAGLLNEVLQRRNQAAALCLTPETWLKSDAYAPVRKALLDQANELTITLLPETLAVNAKTRKDGAASMLLLKLAPGGNGKAFGYDIAYEEDIAGTLQATDTRRELHPARDNRYSLLPVRASVSYANWASLLELTATAPLAGPTEQRGFTLIRQNREELVVQMRMYFDPGIDNGTLTKLYPRLMTDAPRFKAVSTRDRLLEKLAFSENRITSFPFKPFDIRFAYLDALRPLFKEPADDLQQLARIPGNAFLVIGEPNDRAPEGLAAWLSRDICDYDFFAGASRHFPLYIEKDASGPKTKTPNVSPDARYYLETISRVITEHEQQLVERFGGPEAAGANSYFRQEDAYGMFWHFILAVLFTPTYQKENRDALRRDWPRIPIPYWKNPAKFRYSGGSLAMYAQQGRRIAELMAMTPLNPNDWPVLENVAVLAKNTGGAIHVEDLRLSSSWSIKSKKAAIRPGKGVTTVRQYTQKEEDELNAALHNYRIQGKSVRETFGSKTVDVELGNGTFWKNIPELVWNFEIGGFQVLRKWLSYRGENVVNRPLTENECEIFSGISRRLTYLVLAQSVLDYDWSKVCEEAKL